MATRIDSANLCGLELELLDVRISDTDIARWNNPQSYTAGNGINISDGREISLNLLSENGLSIDNSGKLVMSLVQNSANGAMSSDDFRKLYDSVEMVQLLGTEYPLKNWYIGSNNSYATSTTYKSYLIPVSSIGKVSIYDSATTTYYSFLKPYEEGGSSNVPGSTDYAYATGYTGRKSVAQGVTEVALVPSDATWLWVYSGQNKAYDPNSLKFTGIAITDNADIPSPASTSPLMDSGSTGNPGTSANYSRGDHVHPSDTSRVPTTRKVNNKALSADITLTAADVGALPSSTVIPTVGTLNSTASTSQSTSASESFGGQITLHKISKTGNYNDLINTPSIPVNTSDLNNDSGFITSSDIPVTDVTVGGTSVVNSNGVAVVPSIPVNTSDLYNDSGFITSSSVPSPYTSTPTMNSGNGNPGDSANYSRGNHVHPTDTSRAPINSPALSGTPTAPTAAQGTSTTQIATTEFVNAAISGLEPTIEWGTWTNSN